jgi:diguanylate cyclase (GGDEF)-like protein
MGPVGLGATVFERQSVESDRASLVRSFALRSGLLFIAGFIVLGGGVRTAVEDQFRGSAEFHADFVVDSILAPQLDDMRMGPDLTEEETVALAEQIRTFVLDDTVYHVTVWGLDGVAVAADVPEHVGVRASAVDGTVPAVQRALETGEIVSIRQPARYLVDEPPSTETLRTIVPFESGAPLLAEIHQDWSPTLAAARAFSSRLSLGLAGLLLSLWLLLLPIANRASRSLHERSRNDELTGLPNRSTLEERLEHAVERLERNESPVAVLFVDIDGFKAVNDNHGHVRGDALLRDVGRALGERVRRPDVLGRFAGDEFVLVLERTSLELAEQVARRLLHAVRRISSTSPDVHVTASIGVVLTEDPDADVDQLLREADAAMYRAKADGGDVHRVFDAALRETVERRTWIERNLPRAVERDELEMHYQPFFNLQGQQRGEIVAVEALVRWTHGEHGRVRPDEFIAVAEQRGLIPALGSWILQDVCRQLAAWDAVLAEDREFVLYTNLSAVQLRPGLLAEVDRCLASSGARADRLGFEITETAILDESHDVGAILEALRERGCKVALDDFGTGYSSLSRLRTLPLDLLKLDASFLSALEPGTRERAIVTAVSSLTRELSIAVLAEGIETEAQHEAVTHLGFDLAQGYLLARPAPAAEVTVRLGVDPAGLDPADRATAPVS